MQIYCHELGEGEPLVFFHGWGFDHSIWLSLADQFQDRYRLFLVDLPGFGRTEALSWEEFSQALLEKLPKRFKLIGWSLGGLYAQRLALEFPEAVERLLVVASSPRFLSEPHWPGTAASVFHTFYQRLSENGSKILDEFMQLQARGPFEFSGILPTASGLKSGLDHLLTWDLRTPLACLNQKTHFVFGRLDAIVPYQLLAAMKRHYPQFNYHSFRHSAHMPFLSEQLAFIQLINEVCS